MQTKDINLIIAEVNKQAKLHPIGMLPEIRKDLKAKKRLPAKIFTTLTTFEEWAFHHGGRKELQFNIGFEHLEDIDELRFGVAFSLETSKSLPKIDSLIPKVKLFNDFMQLYSEKYADMRMWYYSKVGRSFDYRPTTIPPELVTEGNFIFLGKRQHLDKLDYQLLLDTLDSLLPLYKYVESNGDLPPISTTTVIPFEFHPGRTTKASSTVATLVQRELDVNLRHNVLQETLFHRLVEKYGADNVGEEQQSGAGTSIDMVVRRENEYWFYEIKTAQSPRACIRQAIGQLLEYSFWPGTHKASRLIIVSEAPLDIDSAAYLHTLRECFSLPIEHEQIVMNE
jgi:hypothetical protein